MSVSLTISIPGKQAQEFKDRIKELAMQKGWSVSELTVEALAEYLQLEEPCQ